MDGLYPGVQSNRYVDELRYNDPEPSPERLEEAGYGNMQEFDAEQPTMQSRSQCSSSDDHIPINERKWEDITANEYSSKYDLGHHVLKFVGQLVRHENRRHREADGAFHWRLIDTSEAEIYVLDARRRCLH